MVSLELPDTVVSRSNLITPSCPATHPVVGTLGIVVYTSPPVDGRFSVGAAVLKTTEEELTARQAKEASKTTFPPPSCGYQATSTLTGVVLSQFEGQKKALVL